MKLRVHPVVFFTSALTILAFVICAMLIPERLKALFGVIQDFIVTRLGWFYILSATVFLVFSLWLMFSRFGSIRLGKDNEGPEYSRMTWFAMLFSAGMGIGLVFYGVAEPVIHFSTPRDADPLTAEAAREAMRTTFFHWGLHAWAIYIIIGLCLSYFAYRRDLPLTIRSTLYPLIGDRIHGWAGNTVEILAVFGTLFGIATSLGLGVMQIGSGLEYLGVMEKTTTTLVILICIITSMATASVVSGLNVGIRRLSEGTLIVGLLLMLFLFVLGPTAFEMKILVQSIGGYLQHLLSMSFDTDAFQDSDWQKSWTMFYWGWWISWSPFVGMFIARISRGRTIREFIAGVLLVPTLFTFIWMTVFGGSALHEAMTGTSDIVAAVNANVDTALFKLLDVYPLPEITSFLAILVIAAYFVTSSDSGSLVIDILTSGGDLHSPVWQRVFWALAEGAVAISLLLTGGLIALRTAAITTALPFCVVMLFMSWGLYRSLRREPVGRHGQGGNFS